MEASIKVAARIRPLVKRELDRGDRIVTTVNEPEQQLTIGEKAFVFDHVFNSDTAQSSVYDSCVNNLVEGIFKGFNATVLAYGQTGSGKTHTMGTGMDKTGNIPQEELGIVPRAVQQIFNEIESKKQLAHEHGSPFPVFEVEVSFVELYNENFVDLLAPKNTKTKISLYEDSSKEMVLDGVKRVAVKTPEDLMKLLQMGAAKRTVGATNMNGQSSRSHALFSIFVKQERLRSSGIGYELLTSKFHLVDLAGSESIGKTGATGARAKEGCSINKSLLLLGNVIKALAEKKQVNYRDSKLTRFLKDSLGGNSKTLMIVCAGPSERDLTETRNAMEYAYRMKSIKNKVAANLKNSSSLVADLRQKIEELEKEVLQLQSEKNEEIARLTSTVKILQDALEQSEQRLFELQQRGESLNAEENKSMVESKTQLERLKNSLVRKGKAVKLLLKGIKKSLVFRISCMMN